MFMREYFFFFFRKITIFHNAATQVQIPCWVKQHTIFAFLSVNQKLGRKDSYQWFSFPRKKKCFFVCSKCYPQRLKSFHCVLFLSIFYMSLVQPVITTVVHLRELESFLLWIWIESFVITVVFLKGIQSNKFILSGKEQTTLS